MAKQHSLKRILWAVDPFTTTPGLQFKTGREIIYATDFSPASKAAFEKALDLACKIKAHLTVFHKSEYLIEDAGGAWYQITPLYHEPIEKELAQATREGEKWTSLAREKGVPTELVIDDKAGNIAKSILKVAKGKKTAIIAMVSQSGRFMTAMIGSVTRQVVRHAENPVWVLHPDSN